MGNEGGLDALLKAARLPLRSAYCPVNFTEPAQPQRRSREEGPLGSGDQELRRHGRGHRAEQRQAARVIFAEHKADIVEALNEIGKALDDIGVVGALHQHTGTCVETRDETYAVMEAVDTRYVKFGPDVGQLQKGGSDPVKVVKDFLPVVRHVHMKDFDGGEHYLGYCPLGQGKVDVAALVDLLDSSGNNLMIMAELDPSPKGMPLPPLEAARINKTTLTEAGLRVFRASVRAQRLSVDEPRGSCRPAAHPSSAPRPESTGVAPARRAGRPRRSPPARWVHTTHQRGTAKPAALLRQRERDVGARREAGAPRRRRLYGQSRPDVALTTRY